MMSGPFGRSHGSPENGVASLSASSALLSRAVLMTHVSSSSTASFHSVSLRQQILAAA